jgi:hypothetical protein
MIRSTEDQPLTFGERYSSAIDSSNLRLKENRGDVDIIISAGLVRESLGGTLLRLRVEYDLVRSEHQAAELELRRREQEAPKETGEEGGLSAEERTEAMLKEAHDAALTAHLMILMQLPSLRTAKEQMGHFALQQAAERRLDMAAEHVMRLAGSVLDVHISPTCRMCKGVGFNGNLARGENQKPCRPCKGSGSRRDQLGRDNAERAFAGHMLMELDALVFSVTSQMQRNAAAVREAKERIREAEKAASS